jgi:hypothetical protein
MHYCTCFAFQNDCFAFCVLLHNIDESTKNILHSTVLYIQYIQYVECVVAEFHKSNTRGKSQTRKGSYVKNTKRRNDREGELVSLTAKTKEWSSRSSRCR